MFITGANDAISMSPVRIRLHLGGYKCEMSTISAWAVYFSDLSAAPGKQTSVGYEVTMKNVVFKNPESTGSLSAK